MRNGALDGQGQESEGEKPPSFLCQRQPQIVQARVSHFKALCGRPRNRVGIRTPPRPRNAALAPAWPAVGELGEASWDWVRKGLKNQPQPAHHFSARFLGQSRGSIFAQYKAVAPPLRTPSRNAGRKGDSRAISANHGTFPGKSRDIIFWDFGHIWLLVHRKCPPLGNFLWLGVGSFSYFTK